MSSTHEPSQLLEPSNLLEPLDLSERQANRLIDPPETLISSAFFESCFPETGSWNPPGSRERVHLSF